MANEFIQFKDGEKQAYPTPPPFKEITSKSQIIHKTGIYHYRVMADMNLDGTTIPTNSIGTIQYASDNVDEYAFHFVTTNQQVIEGYKSFASNKANLAFHPHIAELLFGAEAGVHNSIYRGKNLGSSVTAAQWTAISNGSFDDLYIGDYWTINDKNYRIAAFDYYLGTGDTPCFTHHVTIVPDKQLHYGKMNNTGTTAGGYAGCALRTSGLSESLSIINSAFGASHILQHRQCLCNGVTDGHPSSFGWYDSKVECMSEQNVMGCKVISPVGTYVENQTIDRTQFPLFFFNPSLIANFTTYWLRDVVSNSWFAAIHTDGYPRYTTAEGGYGIRPSFSIYA